MSRPGQNSRPRLRFLAPAALSACLNAIPGLPIVLSAAAGLRRYKPLKRYLSHGSNSAAELKNINVASTCLARALGLTW